MSQLQTVLTHCRPHTTGLEISWGKLFWTRALVVISFCKCFSWAVLKVQVLKVLVLESFRKFPVYSVDLELGSANRIRIPWVKRESNL